MMIWIFLPAYDEEKALPKLLRTIKKSFEGHSYCVVVVNDGSKDKTANILAKYRAEMPLDVITHPINRGLGETERDGFEYIAAHSSPADVIVRVEGDDTHDPKYIFDLIHKLEEGYDVVNTSRFQPGGDQLGVDSYRAFISYMANIFMRIVFGIQGVSDFSCGFRAYRAKVVQDALKIFGDNLIQLRGLGFTSTLEIIVKLHLIGCRFAEVPFILRYDKKEGASKMVGSITMLGYIMMAVVYHWPFGGWRWTYRGLRKLYRQDAQAAIDQYNLEALKKRHFTSRINL
jgi:dolichol-phosphate mannosyltransferase